MLFTPAECYVCSQEMSVSSAPAERHVRMMWLSIPFRYQWGYFTLSTEL